MRPKTNLPKSAGEASPSLDSSLYDAVRHTVDTTMVQTRKGYMK